MLNFDVNQKQQLLTKSLILYSGKVIYKAINVDNRVANYLIACQNIKYQIFDGIDFMNLLMIEIDISSGVENLEVGRQLPSTLQGGGCVTFKTRHARPGLRTPGFLKSNVGMCVCMCARVCVYVCMCVCP